MDPITAGLFVAASFATSLASNRNAAKVEEANGRLQVEQTRLQASEATYERTKQFKRNMSANLALAGTGVGGVSGFRSLSAENINDYFADTASLKNQDLFAQISGTVNRARAKSNRFANDVNAGLSAAQLASQLGLFKAGKR